MCNRFVLVLDEDGVGELVPRRDIPAEVLERLLQEGRAQEVATPGRREVFASYNVAPTHNVPIVVNQDGQRKLEIARWGFVPSWWKQDQPPKVATFNARDDKLRDGRFWRGALNQYRCMVPVSGFYEWRHSGKERLPYYIHRKDDRLMGFAGLYSQFTDPQSGKPAYSCTIITTPANKFMEPLHDRIPLVLGDIGEELWSVWLDPQTKFEQVERHVATHEWPEMTMHRVSTDVNPSRGDGYRNEPRLIEPIEPEEEQGSLL